RSGLIERRRAPAEALDDRAQARLLISRSGAPLESAEVTPGVGDRSPSLLGRVFPPGVGRSQDRARCRRSRALLADQRPRREPRQGDPQATPRLGPRVAGEGAQATPGLADALDELAGLVAEACREPDPLGGEVTRTRARSQVRGAVRRGARPRPARLQ